MKNDLNMLLELVQDILANPKKSYVSKGQYGFDCPNCSDIKGLNSGDGKGNLEINLFKLMYHCWGCDISGSLYNLVNKFGNKEHKKRYRLISPKSFHAPAPNKKKLSLPESFTLYSESNPKVRPHSESYRYLKSRGVTDEIIEKYHIGFTYKGEYENRIIIPSYDCNGELNYFVGRSWLKSKLKYKNAESEKSSIIFNEHMIDWNSDLYIVEGVFDSFFVENPLILLGKSLNEYTFNKIYDNATKDIVICLDGDAYEDGVKLYHNLNGGKLFGRIKIAEFPEDKDVSDLKGNIGEFIKTIK